MLWSSAQTNTPQSNINGACNTYIFSQPSSGISLDTLAYLEQRAICQSWDAVFAFWIVGLIFLLWVIVLASQVNRRSID